MGGGETEGGEAEGMEGCWAAAEELGGWTTQGGGVGRDGQHHAVYVVFSPSRRAIEAAFDTGRAQREVGHSRVQRVCAMKAIGNWTADSEPCSPGAQSAKGDLTFAANI